MIYLAVLVTDPKNVTTLGKFQMHANLERVAKVSPFSHRTSDIDGLDVN